jgi:nucleoside-diphosphate-sugar epimerase
VIKRLADSLQVDISKNRELLGWVPKTTVDEELRMLAEASRRS